jgi:glycosyltransferase
MTPVLNILTTTLRLDADFKRTFDSLSPKLSAFLRWYVWINESELSSHSQFNSDYIEIHKGPDNSIYDALNKLVKPIESGYIMVLGAGDTLSTNALVGISNVLSREYDERVVYSFPVYLENRKRVFNPSLKEMSKGMSLPHPGVLMPVELFRQLGGFDISYRISADYDLLLRALLQPSIRIKLIEGVCLVDFKGGGMSEVRGDEAQIENALIQLRITNRSRQSIRAQLVAVISQMLAFDLLS